MTEENQQDLGHSTTSEEGMKPDLETVQIYSSEFVPDPSPLVTTVSQISSILSPYFIVLVGLYLYNSNVWIGIILVAIGILSLLKISLDDIGNWLENIKSFLGLS